MDKETKGSPRPKLKALVTGASVRRGHCCFLSKGVPLHHG